MTDQLTMTTQQLAERMGVTIPTIERWTRLGMPSTRTWRGRRYNADEAITWAHQRSGLIHDPAAVFGTDPPAPD